MAKLFLDLPSGIEQVVLINYGIMFASVLTKSVAITFRFYPIKSVTVY